MTAQAYPLAWPLGRPRAKGRSDAKFRDGGSGGKRVNLELAMNRLESELSAIGAKSVVLSMNIRLTLTGKRDMNVSRGEPFDPGAAVYFNLFNQPHVLACDKWDRTADNIVAISKHIEALRGQERWGVADLRQAFTGHVALPAPEQWWQVLEVPESASIDQIQTAWRNKIAAAHPDNGGSQSAAARINQARDAGLAARSLK